MPKTRRKFFTPSDDNRQWLERHARETSVSESSITNIALNTYRRLLEQLAQMASTERVEATRAVPRRPKSIVAPK